MNLNENPLSLLLEESWFYNILGNLCNIHGDHKAILVLIKILKFIFIFTEWLSTPVFLPGEFHGQRSLMRYSPWGYNKLPSLLQNIKIGLLIFSKSMHSFFFTLKTIFQDLLKGPVVKTLYFQDKECRFDTWLRN